MKTYEFIDKAVFFPKEGILVIGDLHIGFEESLIESGILVPERQVKDIIENIRAIIESIEKRDPKKGNKVNKIVFLGDIKHAFYFEQKEVYEFREVMNFLLKKFNPKDIILIKGNHDTMDYTFEKSMVPYHIDNEILFIHGHKKAGDSLLDQSKFVVMGHTHPSVILVEGVKKEAYKCFLEGKFKGKDVIVLPSFIDIVEGTPVNYYDEDYVEDFSLIPKKDIMKFNVYAIGENEILDFGKVKDFLKD